MIKIYGKLLILGLFCHSLLAESAPFEDVQTQQVYAVRQEQEICVARANVKLFASNAAIQETETTELLNLKDVQSPSTSIYTLENAKNFFRKLGNATLAYTATIESEDLKYQFGDSAATKIAASILHTSWENLSWGQWGAQLTANAAHEFGFINADHAKLLSQGVLSTLPLQEILLNTLISQEGISNLAQMGVKACLGIYAAPIALIAGEEIKAIGDLAGKLVAQAPGYALWLFDETDLAGMPTAKIAAATPEEETVKPTYWNRMKTSSAKVLNKIKHSVDVGIQRVGKSVQAAWDNFTLKNSKSYMMKKIPFSSMLFGKEKVEPKATPVSSVNVEEPLGSAVNEKAKDMELKPSTFDVASANFDVPAGSLAAAAA